MTMAGIGLPAFPVEISLSESDKPVREGNRIVPVVARTLESIFDRLPGNVFTP